jgi:hypothetical protein
LWYLNEKQPEGAPEGNKNAGKQLDQNDPVESTAKKIADQTGVSADILPGLLVSWSP